VSGPRWSFFRLRRSPFFLAFSITPFFSGPREDFWFYLFMEGLVFPSPSKGNFPPFSARKGSSLPSPMQVRPVLTFLESLLLSHAHTSSPSPPYQSDTSPSLLTGSKSFSRFSDRLSFFIRPSREIFPFSPLSLVSPPPSPAFSPRVNRWLPAS